MKTNFTFDELSKIFALAAKIERAAGEQVQAQKDYEGEALIFDEEFKRNNYTFFGAPESLSIMLDRKIAARKTRDKAERKAYKLIKDFADIVGVNDGAFDFTGESVRDYLANKRYFKAESIAESCKVLALRSAR